MYHNEVAHANTTITENQNAETVVAINQGNNYDSKRMSNIANSNKGAKCI